MAATSHDLGSDGEALLVVCSSSSMPSSTTKHAAQCNDSQQRQDQTQINARIDDGAHVTPNKRPSGIPTARRSPSLSHLSSNGAPKWRTGARTAATTQPSVGVSTIYAEPEHVQLKDASRTASRLSANVMKRASQESIARQAEGSLYILSVGEFYLTVIS